MGPSLWHLANAGFLNNPVCPFQFFSKRKDIPEIGEKINFHRREVMVQGTIRSGPEVIDVVLKCIPYRINSCD